MLNSALQQLEVACSTSGRGQILAAAGRCLATAAGTNQMAAIKDLREKSGAPIVDVKNCLMKANWDLEKAYELLREKGLAAASKKASRHASEGLVGLATAAQGDAAVVVEVNSETDFVARTEEFTRLVKLVAQAALALPPSATAASAELDLQQLLSATLPDGSGVTVADACTNVAAKVRENVRLRRGYRLATTGSLSTYLHSSSAPSLGRIASLVTLEAQDGSPLNSAAAAQAADLGQQLAMHAAGLKPLYLDRAAVPAEVLEHERQVLRVQASSSGKPEAVIARMVEGRLSKYYEENCLLDQKFLMDDAIKVQGAVDRLSKSVGQKLRLARFLRIQVGEGLAKEDGADFASEVAQMAGSV